MGNASVLKSAVLTSQRQEHLMTVIMKAGNLSDRSHRRRVGLYYHCRADLTWLCRPATLRA